MKVGSLVVIKPHMLNPGWVIWAQWLPVMDESTVYTVRKIGSCTGTGTPIIMFEEGVIGFLPDHPVLTGKDRELGISYRAVKEVQPPMDISIESLLEETIEK